MLRCSDCKLVMWDRTRNKLSLSHDDVEWLWNKKLLGDTSSQCLLDTVVLMNGLYFTQQSGKEHIQHRFECPQIKVIEDPDERPYLLYTEDI